MFNNSERFYHLLKKYQENAFCHQYIIGYIFNKDVYMIIADEQILAHICKLDKASRGNGYSLRFRPNMAIKTLLNTCQPIWLCSEEFFKTECASNKYNKGENFERLVTNYFGQEWEKDSVPFNMGADLVANGIAYQIKFEQSSFINEGQLMRMGI